MDLIKSFDSVVVENRKVINLRDVKILVDWTPEGLLTKLVDGEGKVISSVIRGFENRDALNKFLRDRFAIKIDSDYVPYLDVESVCIPRFKDMYISQWERKQ